MISLGSKIQSTTDRLMKISMSDLVERINHPQEYVADMIKRLRIVREIDNKQYSLLKRELPYFVCGSFNPPFRKTDNFAYTEYFVVDIDHISQHEMDIEDLKTKLCRDNLVHVIFISPGEDGLKIIFKLSEKCYDAGLYSIFYKKFVSQWAQTHNIEEVVDYCTRDVSRACFLSWDSDVYYNPLSDTVAISSYINTENTLEIFDIKKEIIKEQKEAESQKVEVHSEPEKDILAKIKETLNQKKAIRQESLKVFFVPEQVERIVIGLAAYMEQYSIELYETADIQYGKKLRFRLDLKKAELNLFFGKKGFTVVQCPKSGTSAELNEICQEAVRQYIREMI